MKSALNRTIMIGVATLFAAVDLALPQEQLDSKALAADRCTPKIVQRTPGRFSSQPIAQVIEVSRLVKSSPDGPVCIFEIDVADARNPYAGRKQIYLWEAPGPGQVFSNGHWHSPDWNAELVVMVIRLAGIQLDQVLIRHVMSKGNAALTRLRLYAFRLDSGWQVELLNVAARGRLAVSGEDGNLIIKGQLPTRECDACGDSPEITLRFDSDSKSLAIQSPNERAVAFYKYIENGGRKF